jgi:hypothetical protein
VADKCAGEAFWRAVVKENEHRAARMVRSALKSSGSVLRNQAPP